MDTTGPGAPLLIGEVHTGLLQHSTALPAGAVARVLRIRPGERVGTVDRPIRYAVSPSLFTGVDCGFGGAVGTTRVVGAVSSRSTVTGGHVVQASSFARIAPGVQGRRATWSHYLANPGTLEALGGRLADRADEAFLAGEPPGTSLDLGGINTRLMDVVQAAGLDRRAPFRVPRTRLRWTARHTTDTHIDFGVEEGHLRSLRLGLAPTGRDPWDEVRSFCEDVALHDWLLTGLLHLIDKAVGVDGDDVVRRLRPVVDHLLHLWMPAARPDRTTAPLWASLDRQVGFSRQWDNCAGWVRDRVGIASLHRPAGPR
ncbi:hypothetical protein MCAG_05607 [Micromonospora sp. ATCC 39149]|uniref:Uncharacterized protein n=1 Tax=Micromonospora carbonacea TaxID=47853 RepID=A0A7D6CGH7_9ACTN|nr:SCO2521 family protein [Micromonospora sp. ATCC 39149]EEP75280.1 hypothetical protein MCAG_05607 [Micromonospora sp. ATCC 39149]QLK00999.1 hypothetical protein HZU44_14010 [Micromonospora carbonacea]